MICDHNEKQRYANWGNYINHGLLVELQCQ